MMTNVSLCQDAILYIEVLAVLLDTHLIEKFYHEQMKDMITEADEYNNTQVWISVNQSTKHLNLNISRMTLWLSI